MLAVEVNKWKGYKRGGESYVEVPVYTTTSAGNETKGER